MGFSLWETLEVSRHVHKGVLLQYACHQYLGALVYYSIPWYTYHSYADFISKVLCFPKVDRLDYPSHPCLTSISRGELVSLFCEKAMLWGGTLNFSTTKFTKGPRFFNIVMSFVLTPRSHYNTTTEPHARFLFPLMESLSIDFPSHMIESIIDCYRDTATRDKLIFSLTITHILTHMYITIPPSPYFYVMGAISKESIWRSEVQLTVKRPLVEPSDAATANPVAPSSRPSSSSSPSSSSQAYLLCWYHRAALAHACWFW